ncbi:MAG: hypothetical protein KGN36_08390 [Acidobacteriota bacterium]|nr:hypothetical protein [Acidobacteriota bacterium]
MRSQKATTLTLLTFCAGACYAQVTINPVPSRSVGQARQLSGYAVDTSAPNLVEGREMYQPAGIALDTSATPPVLYVSDTQNNRILVWQNATAFSNGKPADRIIGQLNQYATTAYGPGTSRTAWMRAPSGLAVLDGDLYVVDSGNNRVLRFRAPLSVPAGQPNVPDLVIGQSSLSTHVANAPNGLVTAAGIFTTSGSGIITGAIAFDSNKNLWFTDAGNNRVLRFPYAAISGNNVFAPSADLELGQFDFTSVQTTLVPGTDTGRRTKNQINTPSAIAFDGSGNLYVGDYNPGDPFNTSRVLVFTPPFSSGQTAARIMGVFPVQQQGQPAPTQQAIFSQRMADVQGIFFLPGTQGMGIVDSGFSRVLIFDPFAQWPAETTSFSPVAKALFGHATGIAGTTSLDSKSIAANDGNPQSSAATVSVPQAAVFYNNELFLADTYNNRLIVLPLQNGNFAAAYRLLGQDRYDSNDINLIEGREFQFTSVTTSGVAASAGLALDTSTDAPHLYVADTYNHRILGFKDARGVKAGAAADLVIGQPDMATSVCNYPSGDPNKPTQGGLCYPVGVLVDGAGNRYGADSGNGRVVRYPAPFAHIGSEVADVVLGQINFTSRITDPSQYNMAAPYGLAFAGSNGLLVSDSSQNRVLYFPFTNGGFTSADNGKAAAKVFGQPDFTTITSGNADNQMAGPRHLSSDTDGRPYVVDAGNGRVLVFDQINNTPATGAHAAFTIGGLNNPFGINVNPNTGEIWISEYGASQVRKYPKYDTLVFGAASVNTPANAPLAVIQDQYGDVMVAEATNRVSFYFPGLAGTNWAVNIPNRALAPNAIASLYPLSGGNFGKDTAQSNGVPLPKALADVQVLINGTATPLYYVGPGQINFVMPWSAPTSGYADVQVTKVSTGQVLAAGAVPMDQVSPGIPITSCNGPSCQAAVLNAKDGSINSPSNPVARGDYISIYATGQGWLPNPPADGDVPANLVSTPYTPRVGIGACFVDSCPTTSGETVPANPVQFSGLSPQFPGIWQINVRVPGVTDVTAPVPLVVLVNSVGSNVASITKYNTVIYVK